MLTKFKGLRILTLVIHGEYDLIPVECTAHIAQAIPDARFVVLRDCGHFSFHECPDNVRKVIGNFFHEGPQMNLQARADQTCWSALARTECNATKHITPCLAEEWNFQAGNGSYN